MSNQTYSIKGAIFDCDGTLLDSLDVWRGLEGVLAREAGVVTTLEERKLFTTFTIPEVAHYFHAVHGLAASDEAVVAIINEYMMNYYRTASLLPGAAEAVEACARAGVKMAVASSSCPAYLNAGLESTGLKPYFDAVVSVDDVASTKREPLIFNHVRELLGTPREATWGFDDSLYAMDTLRNAGFPVVGLFDEAGHVPEVEVRKRAQITVPNLAGIYVRQAANGSAEVGEN